MQDKKKIITIALIALAALSLAALVFFMNSAAWENGTPVGVGISCLVCGICLTAISFLSLDNHRLIQIIVRVYGIVDIVASTLMLLF